MPLFTTLPTGPAPSTPSGPPATSTSPIVQLDVNKVNVRVSVDPNWPYCDQWKNYWSTLQQQLVWGFDEDFDEDYAPSYASTEIIGRSESYQTWMSTSNRTIPMTFKFQAQQNDSLESVVMPSRWFEALKDPIIDPSSNLSIAPPPVILVVGKLLVARCVVTSASIKWRGPWVGGSMLPHGSDVAITFTVVRMLAGQASTNYSQDTSDVPIYNQFVAFPTASTYATQQNSAGGTGGDGGGTGGNSA